MISSSSRRVLVVSRATFMVPVGRVIAIYARENGQGMAFPPPTDFLPGTVEEGGELPTQAATPSDAKPVVPAGA
jgi:stringent starvation protein B